MLSTAERLADLARRLNERANTETLATHLTKLQVPGVQIRVAEKDRGATLVRTKGLGILFEPGTGDEKGAYVVTVMFEEGLPEDVVKMVRNALMRRYHFRVVKRGGPITRLINASRADAMREAKMIINHLKARNEGHEILDHLLSEGIELPEAASIPAYPWR